MERMIRHVGFRRGRYIFTCFLLILFPLLLMISCSGPQVQKKSQAKGVYHIVKKGETAYKIARAYSISLQDLAEVNNIMDVSSIQEGSVIFIPEADQAIDDVMAHAKASRSDAKRETGSTDKKLPELAKSSKPVDLPPAAEKTPLPQPLSPEVVAATAGMTEAAAEKNKPGIEEKPPIAEKKDEIRLGKSMFIWPVKGTVKTPFGIQPNKTYHNWIKIVCPVGTQVKAAASGTVIFSSSLPPFGETIIIRHPTDFATVYTHLKKRSVKADQKIKRGEVIALAGEKDDIGDTYINFEIRLKGNKPRNPLFYLP
ncbi:MAG: lipoprotein NlpD [Syntrophaceae bacterium]|nr:MAG: lipoprotein NlpD [Syntrophaceae bacterium]